VYKKILVPLDGSPSAEQVLTLTHTLAAKLPLAVKLFGVVDTVELARGLATVERLYMNTMVADETRRIGEYLAAVEKKFSGLAVTATVAEGHTAELIVANAAAEKDTLIAMATHGRSGLKRFLLGSVAEKVLRGAANPLLLVHATEDVKAADAAPLKSIVVPLDGSELAESVLSTVVELAQKLDLEIILLRAYAIPYGADTGGDGFYDPVNLEAFLDRLRAETVDYLEKKTAELKRGGMARVSCVAKEGLSADEIIQFARATPDSLIAMCSHGYSGVKRWVLGSVTETVVRHTHNPVLVLRAGT
jgi:nucleotide-binding universal stress UspA family protein